MQRQSAVKQATCQHINSLDIDKTFTLNTCSAAVLSLCWHWTTKMVNWIKKKGWESLSSSDFALYISRFKKTAKEQNLQDCFWNAFFNTLLFFPTKSLSRQEIWHLQWHTEMHWDTLWLQRFYSPLWFHFGWQSIFLNSCGSATTGASDSIFSKPSTFL